MDQLKQLRRGARWASLAGTLTAAALLLGLFGSGAFGASGASVSAASFTGGAGTYSSGGTLYAKSGQSVTLNATTSNATCVAVTGAIADRKTAGAVQNSWTFGPVGVGSGADGVQTANITAAPTFNANNCTGNSGTGSASYIRDNTAPIVTGTRSPAANAAGWNNTNVGISWSAGDGSGSGVASGPTPSSDSVSANTNGIVKSSSATDRVGNAGSGSVTIKIDKVSPNISAVASPTPNANGWNNSDVTVSFACADPAPPEGAGKESGIKSCSEPATVTQDGQSATGTAVDNADNSKSTTVGPFHIDKIAPILSGTPTTSPNGAGWYSSDVTIHWTCSDAGSGLDGSCPADSTISGEGSGLAATATVNDKAGNQTTASSAAVKIDRTAPNTNASAPSGWSNSDVSVTLSAGDGLSGVDTTYYTVDGGGQETYSGSGIPLDLEGEHELVFWSVDKAGNEEAHHSVTVRIDASPPTISHVLDPLANANGWNNGDVTVHFVCVDTLSGIASCTADQVVTSEGQSQTVNGTALDNAGNSATDPAGVSVDKTKPDISAAADRSANASGWYNAEVTVSFTCDDALSGIASCPEPKLVGEGVNQSVSGTATDTADNSATATESGINVDETPPALSGAALESPNANGWYSGDVTIAWACEDILSGLATSCPADDTISGEGDNLSVSESVADKGGNVQNTTLAGIKIDRKAPVTSASVPAALESGWYAGAVQVTLAGIDDLSGVDNTYYSVDGGSPQHYSGPFSHSVPGTHTLTFWSVDNAGNAEEQSAAANAIELKIDNIEPSITGNRSPAANGFGWNNGAVIVSFACSDAESGIAGCTDAVNVAGEGAGQSVSGVAVDNAGNSSSATVDNINIDLTSPDISGSLPDPSGIDNNGGKWFKGNVSVVWTCSDGLSGIAAAACPAASLITGEGRNLGVGPASVSDKAGNSSSAAVSGVNIDKKGPKITGAPTTSPNSSGWYSGAVKVAFNCSDPDLSDGSAGSGVAACPSDKELTDEGANLSVTSAETADYAGNTSPGLTVGEINIDNTPPESSDTVHCTVVNGYCNASSPITVTISANDHGLSGVKAIHYAVNGGAEKSDAGNSVVVPITLSASGRASLSFYAIDNAGNKEVRHADSINYDGTKPTVTHELMPTANAADWSNADTLVHFDAVDDAGGSGVNPATVTPDTSYSSETAGLSITGSADDFAGNHGSDTFTFKLDKTPPSITATRSPASGNANGWNNTTVQVSFGCADPAAANGAAASGVAICPDPVTLSTNGANKSLTRSARDLADNTASATVDNINIDMEAPTVTISGIKDDGVYVLGAVPAASCSATDDVSGIDGACETSLSGGLPNGVGAFTYTAAATDRAGNKTSRSVRYRVIYSVPSGAAFFLQPINDTAHQTGLAASIFKAGSTVPVKFQLKRADGSVVQATSLPTWEVPAKGSMTTAPVDESLYSAAADSSSTYRWDSSAQQYIYNWNTAKSQAGYYWRIGVRLDDGQVYYVNIGLRG